MGEFILVTLCMKIQIFMLGKRSHHTKMLETCKKCLTVDTEFLVHPTSSCSSKICCISKYNTKLAGKFYVLACLSSKNLEPYAKLLER